MVWRYDKAVEGSMVCMWHSEEIQESVGFKA